MTISDYLFNKRIQEIQDYCKNILADNELAKSIGLSMWINQEIMREVSEWKH